MPIGTAFVGRSTGWRQGPRRPDSQSSHPGRRRHLPGSSNASDPRRRH